MYKRYRNAAFLMLASGLLSIISFNVLVDPFMVFGSPLIDGLNKNKPAIATQQRLSKAYAIRHFRPQVLILGSSRAEQGIDPEHRAFAGLSTYNAGIPGASIEELRRYFEHAVAVSTPKKVVLTLDFFAFNATRRPTADYVDKRLASASNNAPFYYKDYVNAALIHQALTASNDTFKQQGKVPIYRLNGFAEPEHFQVSRNHRQAFLASERSYMKGTWVPNPTEGFRFSIGRSSSFKNLESILDMAHRNNIQLYLVISPVHARTLEAMDAVGLWALFEEWKHTLAQVNEKVALANGTDEHSLWDFSGYNSITTERVPSVGEEDKRMQWYSEGTHYRASTGTLMLNRVFGLEDSEHMVPADFGRVITTRNIKAHLKEIRRAKEVFQKSQPEDVAEIERIAREVGRYARGREVAGQRL